MKAIWNGEIIAQSKKTILIENNHYFPADSVNQNFLKESNKQTSCPWKGKASYYDVIVKNKVNQDAAWYYKEPKELAKQIKNYVAFWKDIEIIED